MSFRDNTKRLMNNFIVVCSIGLLILLAVKLYPLVEPYGVEPSSAGEKIGVSELKAALDQGKQLVILDVRDRAQFTNAHIPASKNIPLDELEVRGPNELRAADAIVTYCRCLNDEKSELARQTLSSLGFTKVKVLDGGIGRWEEANLSLVSSVR
ncbi:MAG TPA: rhodanese-like domain-containing protein [Pyrinomonadaceae bacterium]|nr:rhodanese-like domain-containing protein [Pyrinomonadaceae bacterium]